MFSKKMFHSLLFGVPCNDFRSQINGNTSPIVMPLSLSLTHTHKHSHSLSLSLSLSLFLTEQKRSFICELRNLIIAITRSLEVEHRLREKNSITKVFFFARLLLTFELRLCGAYVINLPRHGSSVVRITMETYHKRHKVVGSL